MDRRRFVDLTEDQGHVDGSIHHAYPESNLNEFDWTAETEQHCATDEEAMKAIDVLPELRGALVQQKNAARGAGSSAAYELTPKAHRRPRTSATVSNKERRVSVEKLENGRKIPAGTINYRSTDKFYAQRRIHERHKDDQRLHSFEGNQSHRDPLPIDPRTSEYGSRNKLLKRQEFSGNHYDAPYGSKKETLLETNKNHIDRDFVRNRQELDVLKKELEQQICRLNDRQKSLELRESNVMTNLREIEFSKTELEETSSMFRHSVEVYFEKMSNDRKEYELFFDEKASEMKLLKSEYEKEMNLQVEDLHAQFELFEKDMNLRTQQLDDEREQFESFALAKAKELDSREAAQFALQQDIESRLSKCASAEKQLADAIRDFNVSRAARDAEFEALSKQLQQKRDELEIDIKRHKEDVYSWTAMKSKQEEDLESRIVEFETVRRSQQSALELQLEAQRQYQRELDSKEAALNKRSRELRSIRKELAGSKGIGCVASTNNFTKQVPKQNDVGVDRKNPKPIDYILIDSDDDERRSEIAQSSSAQTQSRLLPQQSKAVIASAPQKRRKVVNDPHRFNYEENYSYSLSEETAFELQERLFKEAAEKMRARATFQVSSSSTTKVDFAVSTPIFDIADRHPNHWTWRDPYAVLGLPQQTPMHLVKSQYRRLARTYHPDKSGDSNTSAKFHAISSAYHKLVEKSCL